MVQYSGGENIFEEDVQDSSLVVEDNNKVGAYPRLVASDFFPEVPTLSNPSAMEAYLPFLLDQESYLSEYGAPKISDEELEKVLRKDLEEKQMLEDFDVTDREPNETGGLAGILKL